MASGGTLALAVGGVGQWNSASSNNLGSLITANGGNFAAGSVLGIDTSGGNFTYASAIAGAMGLAKLGGNADLSDRQQRLHRTDDDQRGYADSRLPKAGNGVGTFSVAGSGITIGPNGTLAASQANAIFGYNSSLSNNWPTITNSGVMNDSAAGNISLGPVTLSGGTMMATGAGDQWGTWNLNNTVTVTANSLISAANVDLQGSLAISNAP